MRLWNNALSLRKYIDKILLILPSVIMVLLTSFVGVYFRIHLSLYINGEHFRGPDSYRHVRHIRQIVSNGTLPKVDSMRYVPEGYRNTLNTKAFPWIIAQSFKTLNRFFPDLSLNRVTALYPAVAIFLSCIVYFLLVLNLFDFLTASLSTLALSIAPAFIGRTNVGYVDTDALVIFLFLLAIFFYILSLDSSIFSKLIVYKFIYSGILGIIGLLWLGVSLPAGIIYVCDFIIGIYRKFDRKQAIASILGICLYLSILFLPGSIYQESIFEPFVLSAIIPALLLGLLHLIILIRPDKSQLSEYLNRIFSKKGLIVISLLFAYPLYRIRGIVIAIFERMLFPFGTEPIMKHIGELQPTDFSYWWQSYGLLLPVGLAGFFLLISENFFQSRKIRFSQVHLLLFSAGILCIILPHLFTRFFLRQPIWLSSTVLMIPIGWMIFHTTYLFFKNSAEKVLVFIIWFLIGFSFNSSAVRFVLFFAPVFLLMSSFCMVKALKYFIPDLRENIGFEFLLALNVVIWVLFFCGSDLFMLIQNVFGVHSSIELPIGIRLIIAVGLSLISLGFVIEKSIMKSNLRTAIKSAFGFLMIFSLCFFAYTGIYRLGIGKIGYVHAKPPIKRVQRFAKQIKEGTPSSAIIAAPWNYGSLINETAQRATIIDEEQRIDWIRNFYRKVILGKTVEEMLDFLKLHKATHLMFTIDDIRRLNTYWTCAYPTKPLNSPFVIRLEPLETKDSTMARFEYVPLAKSVSIFDKDSQASKQLHISKIVSEIFPSFEFFLQYNLWYGHLRSHFYSINVN